MRRMSDAKLLASYRIDRPGKISLKDWDCDDSGPFGDKGKEAAEAALAEEVERLDVLQDKLYASRRHAVLAVLQAMDTAGKDGAIGKVFGPLNAQGVNVSSFKKPSELELSHDFLWRIHHACPAKGEITVFNRSHYEDVLVVKVHKWADADEIEARYGHINAFEDMLAHAGTCIVKFYLHISKAEQKKRLQARLDDPEKNWKFSVADVAERKLWSDYRSAYETAIGRCASKRAPWYIIPANRKWYRSWLMARIMRHHLEALDLAYPPPAEGLDKVVLTD